MIYTFTFKNYVRVCFLFCMVSLLNASLLKAQVSQGFETVTGIAIDMVSCYYFDSNNTSEHTLANYVPTCGGTIIVTEPDAGSNLGYTIIFDPLGGNGSIGFTDGDAFGVGTSGAINTELGSPPPAGSQAFLMEDVDGELDMIFSEVDLGGTAGPLFSMQYFLSSTTWEAADYLNIYIEITGCGTSTVTLINTIGSDIDDLGIEGSWNTLMTDLTPYVGCTAQLVVEHSSNSASEELGLDAISFTEGALPVELISFDAKAMDHMVQLDWRTASEFNNKGFEIERSLNTRDWETLDFVDGYGTSAEINQYIFMDEEPVHGVNYYRLKQVDYNGDFAHSSIRVAEFDDGSGKSGYDMTVSPNPAFSYLDVRLPKEISANAELNFQVYNQLGQLVSSEVKTLGDGLARLDINGLDAGMYLLRVEGKNELNSVRFIKQ